MEAPAVDKKKAAMAAFFKKGKKSEAPAATGAAPAPAPSDSASSVAAAPAPSSSESTGWVDAPQEVQRVTLGSRFAARVADLGDEPFDESATQHADIEAEEAKKAFWRARKAPKKKTEEAIVPVTKLTWKERMAASRKGSGGGSVDIRNESAFPSLARATSGFHPSAKFADPGAGDITRFGTASAWAAIAPDDEDEEEEEAAAAAATPAGASAVAPSAAAAVAAASGATGIALRAEELLPGTGDALDTDDAVKEKCSAIATALRLTTDAEEALRCVCELRCVPVGRRERIVDVLLQAGLDAEKMGERVAVRKVLAGLVPRRALTPAMLANGVAAVLEFYDDILVDYPRAADYFEDMLAGLIEGTLPPGAVVAAGGSAAAARAAHKGAFVPAAVLPDPLAKKLGVSHLKAPPAPAPAPAPAAEPAALAAAPAPAAEAPAPAAAAEAATAAPPPASPETAAAAAAAEDELDDMFATAKKKGKKKKAAAGDA